MSRSLSLRALGAFPEVRPGDDLAALVLAAADDARVTLSGGVLVVCQKVVSKAEGRMIALADVTPSPDAVRIGREDGRDPRHTEVILRESRRIVRRGHGVLICETHHGFICANAGVDLSNAPGPDVAVLLPIDPDGSAARMQKELAEQADAPTGVILTDTFGRPWRDGLVDVAIGSAGIAPIQDLRGGRDRSGRELAVTTNATVDQLAAAAGILMVKDAGIPAVWVEGWIPSGDGRVSQLLRAPETDLFR